MSEKPSDWAVAPKFGEWLRGIYASERNPYRDGIYVRTIRRTGRCNPGTYFELTDGNGNFWQYPRDSVIRLDRARELDASGGGAKPTAWQSRSRYWDGAPWSAWQTFNSAEERDADWFPYIGSEWQRETRELYTHPSTAASTQGLRELVQRWRTEAEDNKHLGGSWHKTDLCNTHADELESLLTSPTTGADGVDHG
jgi:hypothetical protein